MQKTLLVGVLLVVLLVGYEIVRAKASTAGSAGGGPAGGVGDPGGKGTKDANGHNVYGTWASPVDPTNPAFFLPGLNPTFGEGSFLTQSPSGSFLAPGDVIELVGNQLSGQAPNPDWPAEVVVLSQAAVSGMAFGAGGTNKDALTPAQQQAQAQAEATGFATTAGVAGASPVPVSGESSSQGVAYGTTYEAQGPIPGNPQNSSTIVTWMGPGSTPFRQFDGWYYPNGPNVWVGVSGDPNYPATNNAAWVASINAQLTTNQGLGGSGGGWGGAAASPAASPGAATTSPMLGSAAISKGAALAGKRLY